MKSGESVRVRSPIVERLEAKALPCVCHEAALYGDRRSLPNFS
jgi:hypothetical protein